MTRYVEPSIYALCNAVKRGCGMHKACTSRQLFRIYQEEVSPPGAGISSRTAHQSHDLINSQGWILPQYLVDTLLGWFPYSLPTLIELPWSPYSLHTFFLE
jgi:hypothetical protein